MKTMLKIEEIAQFVLGIFFFKMLSYDWWWFPALLFVPDVSMIGYFINPKIGATLYNFFHHKALAIICILAGFVLFNNLISLAGAILLAHIALDRFFGLGLKYPDSFFNTHLGKISKNK
jgi:Domain of unknown function (DUF4260)